MSRFLNNNVMELPKEVEQPTTSAFLNQEKPKRLIGNAGLQQILPIRFPVFWQFWRDGRKNDWEPTEVPMGKDIVCWNKAAGDEGSLTPAERRMVMLNLGFFSTAESRIGNHATHALRYYIDSPEARMAIDRLIWEESVHLETFRFIIDSLGIPEKDVYGTYGSLPSIAKKDAFLFEETDKLAGLKLNLSKREDRVTFLKALYAQMIMEGVFFYSGFAMNLRLAGKMPGLAKQYEFIMRDETLHLSIIRTAFNTLKDGEWSDIWDDEMKAWCYSRMQEGVQLEGEYAEECVPDGILNLSVESFKQYNRYLGDRRLEFIGLEPVYGDSNPFEWINKLVDFDIDTNYFEGRRTTYQMSIDW